MNCTNCGKENPRDAHFCGSCGSAVRAPMGSSEFARDSAPVVAGASAGQSVAADSSSSTGASTPALDDIRDQLRRVGANSWLNKNEVKELPKVLEPGETIVHAVGGMYSDANGLLLATNRRILFVAKTFTGRKRIEDFPYDRVTGVRYHGGWVMGSIHIVAATHEAEIKQVNKQTGETFCNQVRTLLAKPVDGAYTITQDDVTSKLERLAALKQQGILTDEEFATQKAKILAG